jgi:hypothetical protein
MQEQPLLCPSSTAATGNLLIGKVHADDTVTLLEQAQPVTDELLASKPADVSLESQYRFAGKCIKSGCTQWDGTGCGVIKLLSDINQALPVEDNLKPCAIRSRCRWYSQEGKRACSLCKFVITDYETKGDFFVEVSILK